MSPDPHTTPRPAARQPLPGQPGSRPPAKPGPRPTAKAAPRSPLTGHPPAELTGRAAEVYRALAAELAAEGYACQCDSRVVALAACTAADVERLEAEVAALPSLACVGSTGQARVHPLVKELRTQRTALAGLYGALLLTPRARSASRLTEEVARNAAARGVDASPKARFFGREG